MCCRCSSVCGVVVADVPFSVVLHVVFVAMCLCVRLCLCVCA